MSLGVYLYQIFIAGKHCFRSASEGGYIWKLCSELSGMESIKACFQFPSFTDQAMHFLIENILKLTNQNILPQDHISLHQDQAYFEIASYEKAPLSKMKDQCCG